MYTLKYGNVTYYSENNLGTAIEQSISLPFGVRGYEDLDKTRIIKNLETRKKTWNLSEKQNNNNL